MTNPDWCQNPKLETVRAGAKFQDKQGDLYRLDRHGDNGVVHVTRLDGVCAGVTYMFAACASAIIVDQSEEPELAK
jgi:hypothetical protein